MNPANPTPVPPADPLPAAELLAAFRTATGLGVRVIGPGNEAPLWACENPFCRLLRQGNFHRPCPAPRCETGNAAGQVFRLQRCAAGLEHVVWAIPGLAGTAGWIESGQVFVKPPRREDFDALCQRMPGWRRADGVAELEAAFFSTPVIRRDQLEAGARLLVLLGRELEPLLLAPDRRLGAGGRDPVETARRFVVQNIHRPLGLAEVSAQAGLCPAHFCRLFKRRTKQTLGDFIARLRVERAKKLLARGGDRAVDVAYAAGFQSVRQFNHVFKTWTGFSPTDFRRSGNLLAPGPADAASGVEAGGAGGIVE